MFGWGSGVAMTTTVLTRRSHEALDLMFGQVFACTKIAVLRAPRHGCSFFGCWPGLLYRRNAHITLQLPVTTVGIIPFLRTEQYNKSHRDRSLNRPVEEIDSFTRPRRAC